MRIFYFGVLGFWLFGYGFNWWNEIGFFFPFFQVHLIKKEVLSILADTLWQPICVCAQMKYFLHNIKENML